MPGMESSIYMNLANSKGLVVLSSLLLLFWRVIIRNVARRGVVYQRHVVPGEALQLRMPAYAGKGWQQGLLWEWK